MKSFFDRIKTKISSKTKKVGKNIEKKVEVGMTTPPEKQPSKRIWFLVVGITIAVLVLAELVFAVLIYGFKMENKTTKTAAKIIPYPAAFTSSGVVTMADFYHEKDYVNHFYSSTKQESSVNQAELDKQIVNQLIENRIVANEAIKMKYKVSDKEINDAVQKIIDSNGGQDKVEKTLQELYGLSLKQFKDLVRTQIIRDKIGKEAIEQVTVRHILIRVDQNAPQDQIDAAKAKIQTITGEIKAGLSFEDAAKKYSEDVGSNEQGGALEPFSRGEMVKEFEDVAFSQPINVVSEPVRTSFGWHLIKVEKKTGFINKSFDDWLTNLKNHSIILIFYRQ